MKLAWRQRVQDACNPLHVQCRLKDAAEWLSRVYERLVWSWLGRLAKNREETL